MTGIPQIRGYTSLYNPKLGVVPPTASELQPQPIRATGLRPCASPHESIRFKFKSDNAIFLSGEGKRPGQSLELVDPVTDYPTR